MASTHCHGNVLAARLMVVNAEERDQRRIVQCRFNAAR